MIFDNLQFSELRIHEFLKELVSKEGVDTLKDGVDTLKELQSLFTLLALEFVNFKGVLKVFLNLFPLALDLLADPEL